MEPTPKNKLMSLPLADYILWFIFFLYLFAQILGFSTGKSTNILIRGMYFIEFGVHEISHMVVFFLPQILVAVAGSVGEISLTLLILYATIKAKTYFASVFAGLWIMLAMNSIGIYMADARAQLLPLAGPSDVVYHDWNYIFGQLGWLNTDAIIGNTVRGIGDVIGAAAIAFGLWLIVTKIIREKNENQQARSEQ